MDRMIFLSIFLVAFFFAQAETVQSVIKETNKPFFIENKGQWSDDVLYLTNRNGMDVWITRDGVVYDFHEYKEPIRQKVEDFRQDMVKPIFSRFGQVVQLTLEGSAATVFPQGTGKQKGYYNYIKGNDSAQWASHVGLYAEANIKGLYKGINARYYFDESRLRYDYIIEPGADVNQLRFKLEGTSGYYIDGQGDLVFMTRFGEIKHSELFVYQETGGQKKEVAAHFVKLKSGSIRFDIAEYDASLPLVIDPLIFSTFIGGVNLDAGQSVTLGSGGNIYVSGWNWSANFPATSGVYDESYNGYGDIFINKISPDGLNLMFATFLGGDGNEDAEKIIIDDDGNIYVSGWTQSTNYPTTIGAFDQSHNGTGDAYMTKVSPDGSSLIYSTFIGGADSDDCYSFALDATGNVYLAGYTSSTNFPTTNGSFDESYDDGIDGFVCKLNATGSDLVYSTYIGGSEIDYVAALALNSFGEVYITGRTRSPEYPTTNGVLSENFNGLLDTYVTKLNATGSALVFSTFLGGNHWDYGEAILLDSSGDIYVSGTTFSSNFPTTNGAFDENYNTFIDVFVSKLNADASALIYSTYVGGGGDDRCYSLDIDENGQVAFTGSTTSSDFPITNDAFDQSQNGDKDVFAGLLNNDGSALIYSSFIGGDSGDYGYSVVIDEVGNAYFTGSTTSLNFPTTSGAIDESQNGNADAFLFKLCVSAQVFFSQNPVSQSICAGSSVTFSVVVTGGQTYQWRKDGVDIAGANNSSLNLMNVSSSDAGEYDCKINGGCGDGISSVAILTVEQTISISQQPTSQEVCEGDEAIFSINALGTTAYQWRKDGVDIAGANNSSLNLMNVSSSDAGQYDCVLSGDCGGINSAAANLLVGQKPKAAYQFTVTGTKIVTTNTSIGASDYLWIFGDGTTATTMSPAHEFTESGSFNIVLIVSNACGSDTLSRNLILTGVDVIAVGFDFSLYPNPNDGQFTIDLSGDYSNQIDLRIFDVLGQLVWQKAWTNRATLKTSINMNETQQFSKGSYFYTLRFGNHLLNGKIFME